jgi:hypothetical protein
MFAHTKKLILPIGVILGIASASRSQESVDVPQVLQENVRSFNLTMDSLRTLTEGIQAQAEIVARQLGAIRRRMDMLPPGSRSYYLERRRYEEKLSDFLAQKQATLAEMQTMRTQTLAHLESILNRMQGSDSASVKPVRERIREQVRRNDERLAQTRIELLQILSQLKKPNLPPDDALRLTRKVRRLRADRQALYEANQKRLAVLLDSAGRQNEELPEVHAALRAMWENLQSGFDWIDAEMAYTQLFAEHRKNWLAIDAQLLEVSGLIERFRGAVAQINAGSAVLKEMEQFLQQVLVSSSNGRSLLPEIPALEWPGKPADAEADRALSTAEIDSLERLIEEQMQKP